MKAEFGRLWPIQLWPIQFWPIHFGPTRLASQFWTNPFLLCCVVPWLVLVWIVVGVGCSCWCWCVFCCVFDVSCGCLSFVVVVRGVFVVRVCVGGVVFSLDPPCAGPPFRRTPLRWTAQNFAFFFPSPAIRSFVSHCVLNFGGVFEAPGPLNVHVWALGLWCEAPAALGPPGLHTTTRKFQTCTFQAPALQTPPKFHEKTLRERRKNEISGGREKKKAQNLGPPTQRRPFALRLFLQTHLPEER